MPRAEDSPPVALAPSRFERALLPTAAASWLGSWFAYSTPAGALMLLAASAFSTMAVMLPQCRRWAKSAIQRETHVLARQREQALSAGAHHAAAWRAIVDTATEGIVTIDAAGAIEAVNDAALRLFGYEAGELPGQNVRVLMPNPYHDEHDGYLRRYITTGERRIIGIGREVRGQRKDGTTFPIDLSVGEGHIDGRRFFTAVIRDITERKDLQTKLGQAERLAAVGELAAGVAHEINNPINTMINCAQLIQDGDDTQENSQIIVEEGQRIADIVRDLLKFARDDRDSPQPSSLPDAIARTLRLIGENWKRHGINLRIDVPDDLPLVLARPQQLQQVLLNLLINAKDALLHSHATDRRVVLIAAPHLDPHGISGVRFSIIDNGPGIDPEVQGRIFEPFVTTKRARGGTGLGLSISRSIIEDYDGTLQVVSIPGEGATFTVWLPNAPPE